MRRVTLTLSHPYIKMRERTTKQAVGKEPPSLGSGGPSLAAIGAKVRKERYGTSV
jgi:hypothetical protein